MATVSCGNREEVGEFRYRLAVVEAVGNHTKCQRFSLGYGFILCDPVHHDAGKVWNFCNPASVFFTINFDFHTSPLMRIVPLETPASKIHLLPNAQHDPQ
jgi:hypothetical protein